VELSGSALHVYWYLLRRGQACGVREVQRALGFSSSSSAHYHLERLADRNVVTKDQHGNYRVNEKVRVRRVSSFVFIRGIAFPLQIIYATATTGMWLLFLAFYWKFLTLTIVLALSPGIVASAIFWYDAITMLQSLSSFERSVR
jgi:hypothetical protein